MQYKQIILIVAMLSIAVGTIVVLGWIFDISVLKSIVPGYNSMKLNTALSFVVAGVIVHNLINIQSKSVVFLLCSFLILLNALLLIQDFFSVDFGIDELLILDSDSQIQGSGFPGRAATSTAFCFILLGISLLLIQSQKRIAQYLFHLVSIVSFIAIIGYFYDVPAFYRLSFLASMAVHTAVMFFIFSLGVSLYNPEIGMTGVFTGNGIGNKMARRLFPAIATTI